ncbi:hypothetical protein [Altericroceibacterium xinjiangense]|uniref:hypothetical protein n=1 Tax=Altericroceibacterium xinjiangense TaxID=762261 RepID=UPI000F7ED6CD|nr:hypothetical protein [Altericroceibacterium xinjiangense]
MKLLLTATAAASALLLSACGSEPEVAETEVVEPVAPAVTPVGATAWDTDNDGMFNQTEYTAWRERGMTEWDTDADGQLNENEFNTGWTNAGFQNGAGLFGDWDDNTDGFVDSNEWFSDDEWSTWDANNSGILEREEFGYY